jgi:hypothetical protein
MWRFDEFLWFGFVVVCVAVLSGCGLLPGSSLRKSWEPFQGYEGEALQESEIAILRDKSGFSICQIDSNFFHVKGTFTGYGETKSEFHLLPGVHHITVGRCRMRCPNGCDPAITRHVLMDFEKGHEYVFRTTGVSRHTVIFGWDLGNEATWLIQDVTTGETVKEWNLTVAQFAHA